MDRSYDTLELGTKLCIDGSATQVIFEFYKISLEQIHFQNNMEFLSIAVMLKMDKARSSWLLMNMGRQNSIL